jgi:hypothetical protein
MARDVPARGETAIEGAVKAGKAAQEALPKGATEYKTREDRNNSCAARMSPPLIVSCCALLARLCDARSLLARSLVVAPQAAAAAARCPPLARQPSAVTAAVIFTPERLQPASILLPGGMRASRTS